MSKNPVAIAAVTLAVVVVAWLMFPKSEEHRIRQRLHELTEVISSTQHQRGTSRLVHVTGLREFFTGDVTVHIGDGIPRVKNRDTLLQMAHVALHHEPALTVAFTDLSVTHDRGTPYARVNATVVVTGVHSQQAKSVDAREVKMDMVKNEGEWRIQAVRPVQVMKLD